MDDEELYVSDDVLEEAIAPSTKKITIPERIGNIYTMAD
jgi:dTDP-4-amino-4,6-dideoxygalactose transaminase